MAYYQKEFCTGAVIEVEKCQIDKPKKKQHRAPKQNPTTEEMFLINELIAEDKLRRSINTNFRPGDFHLVLKYYPKMRPEAKQSRLHLEKFLRTLRSYFKDQNKTLKYIAVTEHTRCTIHHHLIIPQCDVVAISQLWADQDASHWRINVTPLDNTGQYRRLAHYLIKETSKTFRDGAGAYKKRWNASKNLDNPKPETKKVKANQWRSEPVPKKGYLLETDTIKLGVNPFTGLMWQKYSMVRIAPPDPHGSKRKAIGQSYLLQVRNPNDTPEAGGKR